MSKINLFRRVKRLERIINEAKQVGILYHVCTLDSYLDYIVPNNQLSSSGNYKNFLHGGNTDYVSFTRNKYFVVSTSQIQKQKILIQLVIDGDLLSENHKIGPYNDFAFNDQGEHIDDSADINRRESEEAVKGHIDNISKYIKEIYIDVFDMNSGILGAIKNSDLQEYGIKYSHFIKDHQDKDFTLWAKRHGVKDGTPIEYVIPIFNSYIEQIKYGEWLSTADSEYIMKAIKGKADLNAKYTFGYVFELYCYSDKYYDIVKLLVDNKANVNLRLNKNETPIMLAAEYNCPKIINLLASGGADIEATNDDDLTPLMLAVSNDSTKAVSALIDLGADVNAKSQSGKSVLSFSISENMTDLLISKGAT